MSVQKIATMRVLDARQRLGRERGHQAVTLDELVDDTLLAALAELVKPGPKAPTKASIAQAVEDAVAGAREKYNATDRCWCGHRYADHVGRAGCTVCDACTGPRRVEVTPQPGPHAVGADVLVIQRGSQYFGRMGLAVARDGRGLAVQLRGQTGFLHFEHSELCTIPRAPLTDHAPKGK